MRVPTLYNCASANILRAIVGGVVILGYDKLQLIIFGNMYISGGDADKSVCNLYNLHSHSTSSASISNEKEMLEVVVQGQWFMGCDSVVAIQRVWWVYPTSDIENETLTGLAHAVLSHPMPQQPQATGTPSETTPDTPADPKKKKKE